MERLEPACHQASASHGLPSLFFHCSISFASIFRKMGSILQSSWSGAIALMYLADSQAYSCTLPYSLSLLHIFSYDNGMNDTTTIANELTEFTQTYHTVYL